MRNASNLMYGTPNLKGYLAFLYSVAGVPAANFPSAQGVLSAGSVNTATDSTALWTVNQWAPQTNFFAYSFIDTNQGLIGEVASNTSTVLTFSAPLSTAPNIGDSYIIAPQSAIFSFHAAMDTVSTFLPSHAYAMAVYNLATDRLINYAIDVPDQTYFMDVRKKMNITTVSLGVTSGSSDGQTSQQYLNPKFMETLTMGDLQLIKTPYGRAYIELAQSIGTLWGLT